MKTKVEQEAFVSRHRKILDKVSSEMKHSYKENTGVNLEKTLIELTISQKVINWINGLIIFELAVVALTLSLITIYSYEYGASEKLGIELIKASFLPLTIFLLLIFLMVKHIRIRDTSVGELEKFEKIVNGFIPIGYDIIEYAYVLTPDVIRKNLIKTAREVLDLQSFSDFLISRTSSTRAQIDHVKLDSESARNRYIDAHSRLPIFSLCGPEYSQIKLFDAAKISPLSKGKTEKQFIDPVHGFIE